AMSGTFATIFSLEKSRKWIIREGLKGISRAGSGAPIASGLKKSRGLRKCSPGPLGAAGDGSGPSPPVSSIAPPGGGCPLELRPMSDTQALEGNAVQTDQAEREASGAHPYG